MIGIATNVFCWSEGDCIDSILDHSVAGGWKTGDSMSERSDKVVEFIRW